MNPVAIFITAILMASPMIPVFAGSDKGDLEIDLATWKLKIQAQRIKNSAANKSASLEKPLTQFIPADQINSSELFIHKVSDPNLKAILENAYKKPGAVVLHTSIE